MSCQLSLDYLPKPVNHLDALLVIRTSRNTIADYPERPERATARRMCFNDVC
ncbi:hypothetical protein M413DRAFT_167151 [Hebeloma cylindrosporum]|uniref:Uncharacterized protein n=1 Tax=Hebeloma cylindrosporum TaxID=76867 RepID=A0A0C2YI62_HEBCY|nr:hypothetical protein M413DRAFT_167151 [Hebeloma cylindrosporum h7]